jgi:hypothetical protein
VLADLSRPSIQPLEYPEVVLIHAAVLVEIGLLAAGFVGLRDRRNADTAQEHGYVVPIDILITVEVCRDSEWTSRRIHQAVGRRIGALIAGVPYGITASSALPGIRHEGAVV